MLNTISNLKNLKKVCCISERSSIPDQIKVGNFYYVDTTTLATINGDCYADFYDINYTFVGFLDMNHFTAIVDW